MQFLPFLQLFSSQYYNLGGNSTEKLTSIYYDALFSVTDHDALFPVKDQHGTLNTYSTDTTVTHG